MAGGPGAAAMQRLAAASPCCDLGVRRRTRCGVAAASFAFPWHHHAQPSSLSRSAFSYRTLTDSATVPQQSRSAAAPQRARPRAPRRVLATAWQQAAPRGPRGALRSMAAMLREWLAPVLVYQELLKRGGVTLAMMALMRLLSFIPLPTLDRALLVPQGYGLGNPTGTLLHMGIMPFIYASMVLYFLREAQGQDREEGAEGYWSFQRNSNLMGCAFGFVLGVYEAYGLQYAARASQGFVLQSAVFMTAGSCLLNFLAQRVDAGGIGDGISLVLCMNIVAGYGALISSVSQYVVSAAVPLSRVAAALGGYGLLVAAMVVINGAQLRVPMVYYKMRRTKAASSPLVSLADRGVGVASDSTAYIPLRLTRGLSSLLFASYGLEVVLALGHVVSAAALERFYGSWAYLALLSLFIFVLELTGPNWSNARQIADYLTKIEAGIDGVSPGQATERYLRKRERLCRFWGALALTTVLLAVQVIDRLCFGPMYASPGTGLLLIVSLVASASRQVKSLTQAPGIERRLMQQRRALESMVGGGGLSGPGL